MSRKPAVEKNLVETARQNISRVTIFAISVSHYSDPNLIPLPGTLKDLEQIKQIFTNKETQGIYPADRFHALANPNIEDARNFIVDYAYKRSAPGDILIFYFSGHGCIIVANTFAFCMTDTKVRNGAILPLSVLNFPEVVHTLSAADVYPIFIIDACFSGVTASTYFDGYVTMMLEHLRTYSSATYGLLCSSNLDNLSVDTNTGGVFTKALSSVVSAGLSDGQQRYWPFLTLKIISSPLKELLVQQGHPLSRCETGPDLPEVPIARNMGHRPQSIKFTFYMKRIFEFLWNGGVPREVTIHELDEAIGKGSYANHSKLSYSPWKLLEDGDEKSKKRTRRLTRAGEDFARGRRSIPETITKDPISYEWVADTKAESILITNVTKAKREKRPATNKRLQPSRPRQLRIFR